MTGFDKPFTIFLLLLLVCIRACIKGGIGWIPIVMATMRNNKMNIDQSDKVDGNS